VRALTRAEYVAGKGGGMNGSHRADGLWTLAGPHVRAGTRAEAAITDVAPTILHLAGMAVPAWMDGRLLAGVAGAAMTDDRSYNSHPSSAPRHDDGSEAELWRRLAALGYLEGARD
jgi:hypothetical protein